MEGVILHGTGKKARLDGWTAAGKTGTAQKIDPDDRAIFAHECDCIFHGVCADQQSGRDDPGLHRFAGRLSPRRRRRCRASIQAHRGTGAAVSGCAARCAAESAADSDRLPAPRAQTEDDSLDDLSTVDFNAQPDAQEQPGETAKQFEKNLPKSPEVLMSADEGGDIAVPDFAGKTMRDVTDGCLRLGLNPVLIGSRCCNSTVTGGGSKVRRGTKVTVQFGDTPAHSGKSK